MARMNSLENPCLLFFIDRLIAYLQEKSNEVPIARVGRYIAPHRT